MIHPRDLGTGHFLNYIAISHQLEPFGGAHEIESPQTRGSQRKSNADYRVREHLTEAEMDKLFAVLKANRHGPRDWLIGLLIYRHGLRVSEACDCIGAGRL